MNALSAGCEFSLGRPADPGQTPFNLTMDELISTAYENSPEIAAKKKMAEAAGAKVKMAEKEILS